MTGCKILNLRHGETSQHLGYGREGRGLSPIEATLASWIMKEGSLHCIQGTDRQAFTQDGNRSRA